MKYLVLLSALSMLGFDVVAQTLPHVLPITAPNPLADPFNANTKVELPPVPFARPNGIELPTAGLPASNTQSLPATLRVIMIRDKGHALLAGTEAGAYSIPVANAKFVRISGQSYYAEVSNSEVRLFLSPKGKPVWEGMLVGVAPVSVPADTLQIRFIPPLSAGVNPGLKTSASTNVNSPLTPKIIGVQ